MEAELGALLVNCQRGASTRMTLIEMSHAQQPTPEVTESATWDGFINDNILQRRLRYIDMRFYWVRYRVIQGNFLVYWMDGDHNLADYFTKHHPTNHHRAQRSIYLVPTAYISKYACYMYPIDLRGCFESLPAQGKGRWTNTVSLLREK